MKTEKELDDMLQKAFAAGGEPRYIVVDGELLERCDKTMNPPKLSFRELLKRKFPRQFRK